MAIPRIEGAFLGTKVARRILFLFVLCALVPTVTVVGLTHLRLEKEMTRERRERLRRESQLVGEEVLGQLRFWDMKLRGLTADIQRRIELDQLGPLNEQARRGFPTLFLQAAESPDLTLGDDVGELPALTTARKDHLADGGTLMVATEGELPRHLMMARAVDAPNLDAGLLWAKMRIAQLQGVRSSPLIAVSSCIIDYFRKPILCDSEIDATAFSEIPPTRTSAEGAYLEWDQDGSKYEGAYSSIFLKFEFTTPPWTVVSIEPQANRLAILKGYRLSIGLSVLLGLVTVFLVSNVQIRRNLQPIQDLSEATLRVGGGDWDCRVEVRRKDEFGELASSFNSMTALLQTQFDTFTAIRAIDRVVLATPELDAVAPILVAQVREALDSDWAFLTVHGRATDGNGVTFSTGRSEGQVARHEQLFIDRDRLTAFSTMEEPRWLEKDEARGLLEGAGPFATGLDEQLIIPLGIKEDLICAMGVGYAERPTLEDEITSQAHQLGEQSRVALAHVTLMKQQNELSWGAMHALARTIDAKSKWTAGHSERVTQLAIDLGHELALPDEEMEILYRGGLLHDIGKIGVMERVLDDNATDGLSDKDWEVMRAHPEIGARILAPIDAFADVLPLVLHHHEKYDGSGYPHGLAGERIPKLARVLAVADTFDAMTSDRPYREAIPPEKAIDIIRKEAGTQFDPEFSAAFVRLMTRRDAPFRSGVGVRAAMTAWAIPA